MPSRRTFLLAGIAGATALVAAGWLRSGRNAQAVVAGTAGAPSLVPDAQAVIAAVTPVFLDGALPSDPAAAAAAARETVANVGIAVWTQLRSINA
ncbi:MAG: hypothetical protein ABI569_02770, partial [Casimicrobiaceae bacterium]